MTTRIHVPVGTARAVTLREGQTLRIINLVAAVSACPMDLNPISGFRIHDLALEVL